MNFDLVAPFYRWLERAVFGNRLQAARCAFVRQIGQPQRALIVGEGDGRFLEQLRKAHPQLRIECLDASARMLALARARVGDDHVQYLHADLCEAAFPSQRYDLLVTHFLLDCFDEQTLPPAVKKLAGAATADATWLVAEFCEPSRGWRRWGARGLIATMYFFFRLSAGLTTRRLVDYQPYLRAEGFRLTNEMFFGGGMIRSQLWRRA